MKCRWTIRGFFIGLLLLCVGEWVRSFCIYDSAQIYKPHFAQISAYRGRIYVNFERFIYNTNTLSGKKSLSYPNFYSLDIGQRPWWFAFPDRKRHETPLDHPGILRGLSVACRLKRCVDARLERK